MFNWRVKVTDHCGKAGFHQGWFVPTAWFTQSAQSTLSTLVAQVARPQKATPASWRQFWTLLPTIPATMFCSSAFQHGTYGTSVLSTGSDFVVVVFAALYNCAFRHIHLARLPAGKGQHGAIRFHGTRSRNLFRDIFQRSASTFAMLSTHMWSHSWLITIRNVCC